MGAPPSSADGYTYARDAETAYTLTVVLASGQAYIVHAPGGP